jgi:hypothetical protein
LRCVRSRWRSSDGGTLPGCEDCEPHGATNLHRRETGDEIQRRDMVTPPFAMSIQRPQAGLRARE